MFDSVMEFLTGQPATDGYVLNSNCGIFERLDGRCGAWIDGKWRSWPAYRSHITQMGGKTCLLWYGKFYHHGGGGRWELWA